MRRWLETKGYNLCISLAVLRVCNGWPVGWLERLWTGIWYRYYCPHPVGGKWRARDCNEASCCGCSNLDRYGTPEQIAAVRDWKPDAAV